MRDKSAIGLAGKTNERAKWDKRQTFPKNILSRLNPPPPSHHTRPSACILPLVCVGTSRVTVKGHVRQFTGSTHTFALEWVQEVPTHLAVVSWRSRRVVHTPHVIGGALQGETGTRTESREALASYGGAELFFFFFF